jgi:hypothetical protein
LHYFDGDFVMATMAQAIQALAPGAQFSIFGDDYSTLVWLSSDITQPTEEAVVAEQATLDAQQPLVNCTNKASALLSETDWTSIADVANPAVSNPYLTNQAAFLSYRSQVRNLAVNPVADPVWPTQPTAVWSS